MTLLAVLDAFYLEQRCCGDLASVEGERPWLTCICGAMLVPVVAFG